jgi:hypothetical protein
MRNGRRDSITSSKPICRHCGEETDLDLAIRVDAYRIDPTYPRGARFLTCSADCARTILNERTDS